MRQTWWLGVGLFALSLANGVRAEGVPYTATVTVPEAEVRSGAGATEQMYPTNRLRRGDRVEVVKEMDGGWLAIKPPAGSFSWINSRFVERINPGKQMFKVMAPPDATVPVLVGSNIRENKPTVQGTKVKRGTQVRAIGPMRMADDGNWLPIEPPPTELRYLLAEAVRKPNETVAAGAPPSSAVPPGPPGSPVSPDAVPPGAPVPGISVSHPGAASTAVPEPAVHPLWARAQQAEQEGRYVEAIQLYRQLRVEVASTNPALSDQASKRAQWLVDRLQVNPAVAKGGEVRSPSAPPGQVTSASSPAGGQAATVPAGWVSSGPGWLRRGGRCVDYSTMYILENSQGVPIVYATARAGYSLEPYLNRNVELIGVRQYRGDLRAYHMTAMQVQPLR